MLVAGTKSLLREKGARAEELLHRTLAGVGVRQSESRISADSQQYWTEARPSRWKSDSHWRESGVFAGNDLWSRIGARHLEMFDRGARMVEFSRTWDRVLEWGCGGGANAVHFAPRAGEFIGVDISDATLEECRAQVAAACDTPFHAVRTEVAEPEAVIGEIEAGCDVFLCTYVFELIPTPGYGERLLRIAHHLLAPGGLAFIQVKYDQGRFWTKPRGRSYRRGIADMTTYPIDRFWELAEETGFKPESIELVPSNELDKRYAYYLLSKPQSGR